MKSYYGLIPAAGLATRMRPFRYPKELLPVLYQHVDENNFLRPKLLIEYSLEALSLAGVKNIYMVVPDWKPEIMRYLEDGGHFGHHISYLYNSKALGLSDALLSGHAWLHDKNTCFAMPDTIFSPANAFTEIIKIFEKEGCDLVLGIFPTDEPQHFAPVEFGDGQRIINIEEKPISPKANNTWGIAVWNANFWEFFKTRTSHITPGTSITDAFNDAAKSHLNVRYVYFKEGSYKDIGRFDGVSF